MTTGTKVFLAVFATLIAVMVVYYGVLLPEPASLQTPSAEVGSTNDVRPASAEPQPTLGEQERVVANPLPVEPVLEETVTAPQPGLLGQAVQNVVNGETTTPNTSESNLTDGRVVTEVPDPGITTPAGPHPLATGPASPSREPSAVLPPVANQPVTIVPSKPQIAENAHIVQAGDTMTSIAEQWFGDPNKWSLIAKENPLVDPARLAIGQRLRLPSKDAKPAPVKEAVKDDSTFTVRSGDTLAKIAREYYGDVARWKAIYEANRALIGNDAAALKPGMKLKMPAKSTSG